MDPLEVEPLDVPELEPLLEEEEVLPEELLVELDELLLELDEAVVEADPLEALALVEPALLLPVEVVPLLAQSVEAGLQAPLRHCCPEAQAAQLAPARPQAFTVGISHLPFASQQPSQLSGPHLDEEQPNEANARTMRATGSVRKNNLRVRRVTPAGE
ncbi:MAG: hypothetical protein JST54_35440 [Deltaproteobacteria bacterium]|nr:hypothetical protein [Deltaproteobacteria bacterium]